MMAFKLAWLVATVMTSAQNPPEPPSVWKQKYEAAEKAEKAGDHATAEALLTGVVREAETLGQDDPRLAEPLERLATLNLKGTPKQLAEAEPLFFRALLIREKTQGTEHPDVADTLISLAGCRMKAKGSQRDAAGPMLQRALTIYEKSKGKDDPEVARVLHCRAVWHLMRREYGEAEPDLNRALAIREKAFGPESAKVADILDDLGDLHAAHSAGLLNVMARRDRLKAEACYGRALAIREKILKPDDPDLAESLYNLGQYALYRGKTADAERYLDRCLELKKDSKAPLSEEQDKAIRLLAKAALGRKDRADAERRMAKVQSMVEAATGAGSDEVAMILSERAEIALEAGRFNDAEHFLKRGLEIQTARFGPDNPDVSEARALLAERPKDRAGDQQGLTISHRLKALGRRASGENHHEALGSILDHYADLLRRTNRDTPRPSD